MTITIRTAEAFDLAAILSLYGEFNPDDPALDPAVAGTVFEEILERKGVELLLAVKGGAPAGSLTLIVIPNLTRSARPYAFLENVVTAKAHRRTGIGRALIAEAVARAQQANCYKLMLLTGLDNPAVHAFYQETGFQRAKAGFEMRF